MPWKMPVRFVLFFSLGIVVTVGSFAYSPRTSGKEGLAPEDASSRDLTLRDANPLPVPDDFHSGVTAGYGGVTGTGPMLVTSMFPGQVALVGKRQYRMPADAEIRGYAELYPGRAGCCGDGEKPEPIASYRTKGQFVPSMQLVNDVVPIGFDASPGIYFVRFGVEVKFKDEWKSMASASADIIVE
ncbi:hypothetical protein AB1L88_26805 [Tautonia sp. JC769]|uniref:hypothetical protein n=1 Tax=Tautonia sp. JC769 TaxID=3232135 RepID=UPI00345863A0